jgi:ketosteroid isomerase-like protein
MAAQLSLRTAFLGGALLQSIWTMGFAMPAVAAPATPRAHRHEYRHEIDQLEEAWRTAMLKAGSDAMNNLLADDYTGITATGLIQTKQQTLDDLRTGTLKLTGLSIYDRKVRLYGATAVVTSQAELTGSRGDQELTGKYRYTRVYIRNAQGQWKIVSFEASRIQENGDHK